MHDIPSVVLGLRLICVFANFLEGISFREYRRHSWFYPVLFVGPLYFLRGDVCEFARHPCRLVS